VKNLDSGACPGHDPGFAGMTPKRTKSIFSQLPFFKGGFEGENLFKDKLLDWS
jgi:hypothetical protein